MKERPLISVITPTLNCESTVEACLTSVADQTYKRTEHLVIDGLSSDKTLRIIRNFQNHFAHVKLVSEQDCGIYDAMNKGIEMATGEWIYFLGSDDTLYTNNVFEELRPLLMQSIPEVIYGNVIFKNSGTKYDGKFNKCKLLKKNICHQSILIRKSVFDKLGKFDIRYKAFADWHFNMMWFNDSTIKHLYTKTIISCFCENGSSHNTSDINFCQDWDHNTELYFPKHVRILGKYSYKAVMKKILNKRIYH